MEKSKKQLILIWHIFTKGRDLILFNFHPQPIIAPAGTYSKLLMYILVKLMNPEGKTNFLIYHLSFILRNTKCLSKISKIDFNGP